jgi:hypothetical protein
MYSSHQANSKFSQVQQNPAKPGQRQSKKKALIPFDFLGRIEAFQSVAVTPWAKNLLLLLSRPLGRPARTRLLRRLSKDTMISDFRKAKSPESSPFPVTS